MGVAKLDRSRKDSSELVSTCCVTLFKDGDNVARVLVVVGLELHCVFVTADSMYCVRSHDDCDGWCSTRGELERALLKRENTGVR